MPLYRALNANAHVLPVPLVNLINGGKHASNDLDFQEFIVIPVGRRLDPRGAADLDRGQPRARRDPARALRQERPQHGRRGRLRARDLRPAARRSACCTRRSPTPATRAASATASTAPRPTTTTASSGTYALAGETRDTDAMIELYLELIRDFDVITIEDPLDEEDFAGFARLTAESGIQIVGDDLFVTNPERLRTGDRRRTPPTRCCGR